jgi:hypothetical protein
MLKQLIDAICLRLINGPLPGPSTGEFTIAKLDIKSGDFLIICFRNPLSKAQVDRLRERMKDVLPADVKALVFEGEVNFSVLSKSKGDHLTEVA